MSKSKTGAIIVIEKNDNLDLILKTGRTINSNLSQIMIEKYFFYKTLLYMMGQL